MRHTIIETKLGFFGILANKGTIIRTSLPVHDRIRAENDLLTGLKGTKFDPQLFTNLQKQIKLYFEGTYTDFDTNIPLQMDNLSQFSQDILKACQKIQYGQTVPYNEIAKMANHPKAARAAGNALANNPLPLIIPCHRVIKSDGKTGGFQKNRAGAPDLKKRMLNLEVA